MSSWTLPSMSMLVTGEIKPLADQAILAAHESIAESFHAAGYRTAGVLGNPLLSEDYGYDRGLDHCDRDSDRCSRGSASDECRWLRH